MCRSFPAVLWLTLVLAISGLHHVASGAGEEFVEGAVVLRFKLGYMPEPQHVSLKDARFGHAGLDSLVSRHSGSTLIKYLPTYNSQPSAAGRRLERSFVLYYADGTDPHAVAREFAQFPHFEKVEPIKKVRAAFFGTKQHFPLDNKFNTQWSLDTLDMQGDRIDIDAPEAWAIEQGEENVVIGIIDSGHMVDTFVVPTAPWKMHSDFTYYFNPAEDKGTPNEFNWSDVDGVDNSMIPDADTLRDNIAGYNFDAEGVPRVSQTPVVVTEQQIRIWSAMPHNGTLTPSTSDGWQLNGHLDHGVHVASVAAARDAGGTSVVGVAHGSKIYPLRVDIQSSGTLVDPTTFLLAILEGASKCDVINMSWGFFEDPLQGFHDAILTAADTTGFDCVLVASVGNISDFPESVEDTFVTWPSRYPEVIGVGNMNKNVTRYHDSTFGDVVGHVSVVAPTGSGVPVNSHKQCSEHVPPEEVVNGDCPKTETLKTAFNGTSAASPHVAGIAALVRSRFPGLNSRQVRDRIVKSAQWYWNNTHQDSLELGHGKVNAYRAVTQWGTIQGNVTWSSQAAAGPSDIYTKDDIFYVSGDLTIENGAILAIDKNVTIRVAPDHEKLGTDLTKVEIIVKNGGTLEIRGESGEEVVFESFTDLPPATNDWIGITFENGSHGLLEHVEIGNSSVAVKVDGLSQPVTVVDWDTNKKLYLNSAVSIASDYTVASSDSLYVLGSTDAVVTGGGNISLQVDGSLICVGSPTKQPTFRSSTGVASSWDGIGFTSSSQGNVLDDVIVKHAFIGIQNDVPLELSRCEISHGEEGIENNATSLTVRNSKITNQESYGIQLLAGTATIVKDTISDSFLGVWALAGATVNCDSSLFQNLDYAALLASSDGTISVEDSRMDNTLYGVRFTLDNQGIVERCTITNSTGDGIYVDGATLPIIKNCVIDNSATNGIYCQLYGDLVIQGTTVKNSPVGVYCYAFASPTLKARNMIKACTTGLKCAVNSHPVVEETTIKENTTGVRALSGSNPDLGQTTGGPSVGDNVIESNTLSLVKNTTGIEIQAERNYWGSAAGPDPAKINGLVDYVPWLINKPEIEPEWEGVVVYMPPVDSEFPARYDLAYNYPNPFNPTTRIKYDVPSPGGVVQLVIYNVRGQRVATLLDERRPPGVHTVMWDGRDDAGEPVATGVYFVQMRSGPFRETKKLVLLK